MRGLLQSRVDVFKSLARDRGLRHPRYEGGFFVACFTPDAQITSKRMQELGVFVVPLKGAVRVALCATAEKDLPRLVEALGEGIAAAGG